jgi:galactokinase
MGKGVPTVHSLSDVYVDINNSMKDFHEPRFKNIRKRFQELYGCAPAFYCRAPGRVNTMGDHIDCNGYSVMPMALE